MAKVFTLDAKKVAAAGLTEPDVTRIAHFLAKAAEAANAIGVTICIGPSGCQVRGSGQTLASVAGPWTAGGGPRKAHPGGNRGDHRRMPQQAGDNPKE